MTSTLSGLKRERSFGRAGFAFTLIELLVVISIIALMIAILLPALQSAKYQANLSLCASRLRQLAIAGSSYASDHNEHSPDGQWMTKLPEMGYLQLGAGHVGMYCPIASEASHTAYRPNLKPGWPYAINIALAAKNNWPNTTGLPARLADVRVSHSRVMFFSDGGWRVILLRPLCRRHRPPGPSQPESVQRQRSFHDQPRHPRRERGRPRLFHAVARRKESNRDPAQPRL
jgi:prepilin-type N-terminal cleavage/methylation domain-containing protein